MNKIPDINYIDMPAELKDRHQYYTQADMARLERPGCDIQFHSLEDGVSDYIKDYLMNPDPYLWEREEKKGDWGGEGRTFYRRFFPPPPKPLFSHLKDFWPY